MAAARERNRSQAEILTGYIINSGTLEQEYLRFHGKLLKNAAVSQQFEQAVDAMKRRDYASAADLLEAVSKQAALPVVFNDLGVLYAALNDLSGAVNAFRSALERDNDYQPVRYNLGRLGYNSISANLVTREVERNDTNLLANGIALGQPVEAEINADLGDVDCFRVTTPPAPRDILAIEVQNRSQTLAPVLKIYDAESRILDWGKESKHPGDSLTVYIAPQPNVTLYVVVSGYGSTGGAYRLNVKPLKAFDAYEPNDDILSARRILIGQTIEANIMDAQDTDYYSFLSPRTGFVSINIRNRSTTLIPALTTFTPDMRNSGFGQDVRALGAGLHHSMEVQEGLVYFLQVWSQGNSTGAYDLTVE